MLLPGEYRLLTTAVTVIVLHVPWLVRSLMLHFALFKYTIHSRIRTSVLSKYQRSIVNYQTHYDKRRRYP